MIEGIFIGILFVASVLFLVQRFRKSFTLKKGCPGGCGCSGINLAEIEEKIKKGSAVVQPKDQ